MGRYVVHSIIPPYLPACLASCSALSIQIHGPGEARKKGGVILISIPSDDVPG